MSCVDNVIVSSSLVRVSCCGVGYRVPVLGVGYISLVSFKLVPCCDDFINGFNACIVICGGIIGASTEMSSAIALRLKKIPSSSALSERIISSEPTDDIGMFSLLSDVDQWTVVPHKLATNF